MVYLNFYVRIIFITGTFVIYKCGVFRFSGNTHVSFEGIILAVFNTKE